MKKVGMFIIRLISGYTIGLSCLELMGPTLPALMVGFCLSLLFGAICLPEIFRQIGLQEPPKEPKK